MKNKQGTSHHHTASATRMLFLVLTFTMTSLVLAQAATFTIKQYAVGKNPVSVVIGDFNGDNNPDLAVANYDSNTVGVLLGSSNGTFRPAVNYIVGANPAGIAIGDFNSDHHLDLAVASAGNAAVSILLGRGDGTFEPAIDYPAGDGVVSIAAADFNGDKKLDLAVTRTVGVATLLGNGDGTFRGPFVVWNIGTPTVAVVTADFNNDGKMDIAAKQGLGTNNDTSLNVILGLGTNRFRWSWHDDPVLQIPSFVIGDFDGDGKLDMAALYNTRVGFGIRLVQVLHNNGNGTFTKTWNQQIGLPGFITAGFLNHDKHLDLGILGLPSGSLPSRLILLLGNADGTFQAPQTLKLSTPATSMVIRDLNHDGLGDIVLTNSTKNTISVLLNIPGS